MTTDRRQVRESGLLAGDVARALGIGMQTLHCYERQGLIPPPRRSLAGYRLYGPEIVERLRFIRKAQALGFTLGEIQEILALAARGTSPCGTVQTRLAEKLRDVDTRLAELRTFRADLARLVAQAGELGTRGAEAQVCSIVEEAPELWVPDVVKTPVARKRRSSVAHGELRRSQ